MNKNESDYYTIPNSVSVVAVIVVWKSCASNWM